MGKPSFVSTEEYFEAATRLMAQLEHAGHDEAAGHGLDPENRRTLETLRKVAHAAAYRR